MIRKFFLFYFLSLIIWISAFGQVFPSGTEANESITSSGEKIGIFTDRNIYCVKEKIYFSANYECTAELDSLSWSNILYVELIRWNGMKLAQVVEKLSRPVTSGFLQIPDNLPSGNYYLRAYTKWMRNFSPEDYAYVLVKIVNPYKEETDDGQAEASGKSLNASPKLSPGSLQNVVSCSVSKNEFAPREKVEVEFRLNDGSFIDHDNFCVSVVKLGSIDTINYSYRPVSSVQGNNHSQMDYLPEIRGITISGEIVSKSSKLPQKEVFVSLSEPKSGEYFSVYETDANGRFIFSLPDIQGNRDFYIQTDQNDSIAAEILIDNSFCNKPVKLPYIAFKLNEEEKKLVKEMAVTLQLNDRFLQKGDTLTSLSGSKSAIIPFYGTQKVVYNTERYIELPNVEEFISEVVMEAIIVKQKDKTSVISMRRSSGLNTVPLIFLDNIQVSNSDQLLNLPLSRISRLEVLDKEYVVAGMKYSGIINIYSNSKDFAGLDLSKNSMFFTYELLSQTNSEIAFGKELITERIPERRNILYWNPNLNLSTEKKAAISFYTSDIKGDYVVYIRRKSSNNNIELYGKSYFSVK